MTSLDHYDWLNDRLASEDCCLTDAEAEAAEAEQLERGRIKKQCAVALVRLGLTPMSFVTERIVRGK
jgi:hypothetical protein